MFSRRTFTRALVAASLCLTSTTWSAALAQSGQSDWVRPSNTGWKPTRSILSPATGVPSNAMPTSSGPDFDDMPAATNGPELSDDGTMPWQDAPRKRRAPVQTPAPTAPADVAFKGAPPAQHLDPWHLPSNQPDLEWAKNLPPEVPLNMVMPDSASGTRNAATKFGAAQTGPVSAKNFHHPPVAQPPLSGSVMETSPQLQSPMMNPDAGFAPVQRAAPMANSFAPAAPPAMSGMPASPAAALLGGMMGGGQSNPLDAIGKAIAGAAAMGLIPSSGSQGAPNVPQMGGGMVPQGMSQPGMMPMQMQQLQQVQQIQPVQQFQQAPMQAVPGMQTARRMGKTVTRRADQAVTNRMGGMLNQSLSRIHW